MKFSDLSAACLYHDLYLLFVSINNATAALPAKNRDGEKLKFEIPFQLKFRLVPFGHDDLNLTQN